MDNLKEQTLKKNLKVVEKLDHMEDLIKNVTVDRKMEAKRLIEKYNLDLEVVTEGGIAGRGFDVRVKENATF